MAFLSTYAKQVEDTQRLLTGWHQSTAKRLNIDIEEIRRRRIDFDRVIHFIPGLFNDDFNFKAISESTADMIMLQALGQVIDYQHDTTDLYAEDVQLISKNGKIYYLPLDKA